MDIVKEIQAEVKGIIAALFPDYSQLDYEYNIEKNNESALNKKFGFIPAGATFESGRALGFTTMLHSFELILTTDYQNYDDDVAQSNALHDLYSKGHIVIKDLQSKGISLPTSGYTVLLINGANFEAAEFDEENSTALIRVALDITYRFRNNLI